MTDSQAQPIRVLGDKVWCPLCNDHVKLVRVTSAAKIVDVDRRTVYKYVKTKQVFGIKVAGQTLRVCSSCLLRPNDIANVQNQQALARTGSVAISGGDLHD
jgi:hypothetical protein